MDEQAKTAISNRRSGRLICRQSPGVAAPRGIACCLLQLGSMKAAAVLKPKARVTSILWSFHMQKLSLTIKLAQNMQQTGLLFKRGEWDHAVPSPAEAASSYEAGLSTLQERTSNIHTESHGCCALQKVREQTWDMFSRPLLKGHRKF